MRFGRLFESKEIDDLTHEVLTSHGYQGFSLTGDYQGYHWRGDDMHPTDELRTDLKGVGWTPHHSTGQDMDGWSADEYSHPDHHMLLRNSYKDRLDHRSSSFYMIHPGHSFKL